MTEDFFDYRHRRRRVGRLRAGEPADGGRHGDGHAAGVRRVRRVHPDPDAQRAVHPDEHAQVQLGLRDGAGAAPWRGGRMHTPRGKVLGGSSSINGMVYVRGNPHDFDRWEEEGAAGWGYRHVLPYFRRAEASGRAAGTTTAAAIGPLHTRYGTMREPAARRLAGGGGHQAGYPMTDARLQRAAAGGLRPDGHDRPQRTALERGQRLPEAGAVNGRTCTVDDPRAGHRHRVPGPLRRGRALPARRGGARGAGPTAT